MFKIKFRNKNKDELPDNISEIISESKNILINHIFFNKLNEETKEEAEEEENNQDQNSKKKKTLSDKFLTGKFRQQIKELMSELNSSDCHFIRCIKPNEQKQKNSFVGQLVLQQIRYMGVVDSIKIRKESFPVRIVFFKFFQKFYELHPTCYKLTYEEVMKEDLQKDYKNLSKE